MGNDLFAEFKFSVIPKFVAERVLGSLECCPLCLSRSLSAGPENAASHHFASGPLGTQKQPFQSDGRELFEYFL